MNEKQQIVKRIKLKTQALQLINEELAELRHIRNLTRLRDFLQNQIKTEINSLLSEQLDWVQYLIEAFNENFCCRRAK